MSLQKYKVEFGVPNSVPERNTIEDLRGYLETNPHPRYHLVSAQNLGRNYLMVWELKE